jgi:hypothetical protein
MFVRSLVNTSPHEQRRCHDSWHNDTKDIDSEHNIIQHNSIQSKHTLAIFVIMLNVIMVGVVIPTVVAPKKRHCKKVFFLKEI